MSFTLDPVWRILSTGLLACGLVMILAPSPSHGCPDGFCSVKKCSSGRTCVVQEIWCSSRLYESGSRNIRLREYGLYTEAGLEVFLHREVISGTDVELIEKAYSPKTGFSPLRSIIKHRDGSIQVSEAMKVVFKEVPTNDDLKALPVRQQ